MSKVRLYSKYFAGKQVNVPHSEHRGIGDGPIQFDADGFTEVPQESASFLLSVAGYAPFISEAPKPAVKKSK